MRLQKFKLDSGGVKWTLRPTVYNPDCHGEFYLGRRDFAVTAEFNADGERTATFHVAIPFVFSAYFGIDRKWGYSDLWRKLLRLDEDHRYGGRHFGLAWNGSYGCVDGGSFRLSLGERTNEYNSRDPKWYSFNWYPQRTFCGPTTYTQKDVATAARTVTVPGHGRFPTKDYHLTATMSTCTWSWKRFKKPLVITRCEVKCEGGIEHPGKGTACYNCDDTALTSSMFPCDNFDDAFEKFVESAQENRRRYPL